MSHTHFKLSQLFCLDGLWLDRMELEEEKVVLFVRSPRTTSRCPGCGRSLRRVHKTINRFLKHGLWNDQLVYLKIKVRTFRCRWCGLFRETFPGVDRRQSTNNFRLQAVPKVRNRSFRDVAKEHGLSSTSLVKAVREVATVGPQWPDQPFALGIDEHSFAGQDLVITITNITGHQLLGILPDDRQTTLRQYLSNLPINIKSKLLGVCIDMKASYLAVSQAVLPQLPVVVDKFHVIQYLNWHLNQLRSVYTSAGYRLPKRLLEKNREDLSDKESQQRQTICVRFPTIGELWRIKEMVRTMYQGTDYQQAARRFDSLVDGLRGDSRPRFKVIYGTFHKWRDYILNYFKLFITNAYTEGVHTKIKLLKRISYGFRNKLNYIAKMTIAFLPLTILLDTFKTSPCLT